MSSPQVLHVPLSERLKSIPEAFGIRLNEEPRYQTLASNHYYEIRRYPRQVRAKVTLSNLSFDQFRPQAFKILAAYFFGQNAEGQVLAMTAPVLEKRENPDGASFFEVPGIEEAEGDELWSMSFVLPAKYILERAPKPLDAQIEIEELDPYIVGVTTYSGNNSLSKMKLYQNRLARWLLTQDGFQNTGRFWVAQYDGPFVLPFLKRNEIQVEVLRVGTTGQIGRP